MGCGASTSAGGGPMPIDGPVPAGSSVASPVASPRRHGSGRSLRLSDDDGSLSASITEAENAALASALRVAQSEMNKLQEENNRLQHRQDSDSIRIDIKDSPRRAVANEDGELDPAWVAKSPPPPIPAIIPTGEPQHHQHSVDVTFCGGVMASADVARRSIIPVCSVKPRGGMQTDPEGAEADVVIVCAHVDGLQGGTGLQDYLGRNNVVRLFSGAPRPRASDDDLAVGRGAGGDEAGLGDGLHDSLSSLPHPAREGEGSSSSNTSPGGSPTPPGGGGGTGEAGDYAVERAVAGCNLGVVVVVSQSWASSSACVMGMRAAGLYGKHCCVVHLAESCKYPDVNQLPADLQAAMSRRALPFTLRHGAMDAASVEEDLRHGSARAHRHST